MATSLEVSLAATAAHKRFDVDDSYNRAQMCWMLVSNRYTERIYRTKRVLQLSEEFGISTDGLLCVPEPEYRTNDQWRTLTISALHDLTDEQRDRLVELLS